MDHTIEWEAFDTVLSFWDGYNGDMSDVRAIRFSAKNLRKIRRELKLTQKGLAQGSVLSKQTIEGLEQGVLDNPTREVLAKISRYLTSVHGSAKIVFWIDFAVNEQDLEPDTDLDLEPIIEDESESD